jgi:secreted Zn-dependent insulinase-like peptidase
MYVVISSKTFENKTTNIEKWYNIQYNLYQNINHNYIKINYMDTFDKIKQMVQLPEINKYIPLYKSFELKNNQIIKKDPTLIETYNNIIVFYKPNTIINIPKTSIIIKIMSEWLFESKINKILLNFYIKIIRFLNYDFFNSIKIAGYNIMIKVLHNKIILIISGISSNINIVIEKLIDIIFNTSIDKNIFIFQKTMEIQKIKNKMYEPPHSYAYSVLKHNLVPFDVSFKEELEIINKLNYDTLMNILSSFINKKTNTPIMI